MSLIEEISEENIINCSCLFYNFGKSGTGYIEK